MSIFRNSSLCVTVGIFLAVILLFATAYKAHLNKDRIERFRERDQKAKAAYELGVEVTYRIGAATGHITLDDFQKKADIVIKISETRSSNSKFNKG